MPDDSQLLGNVFLNFTLPCTTLSLSYLTFAASTKYARSLLGFVCGSICKCKDKARL